MTLAAHALVYLMLFVYLACLLSTFALIGDARADGPRVAKIELHGMLTGSMASFVGDQLDQAWRNGYSGVILDIDLVGGDNAAAEQVKSAILSRSAANPLAAYVHDRSI